ncbi:MAG: LysR family transcriptional regulator [Roseburia sp.]|uniref:LysR family transcriptional regulator n=1 Tax=Roseburia sp. 831b TaxID=1261635 RepID=UPI0009514104|nr:LysR family transcriptional regulator [Roseburia sp. 831b]MCI5920162.1 LysR family transcriptional regulator [Roseburia sp.]MDD6216281.1 LysR family transcriptional regulator [Roseburia sp.]MDY5883813.1 LysR family transcriptional regulator [Roseburia sp.]WVK72082.1 LysR family transcriptional regulator [Roseburia sp. 831b]
MNIEYLKYFAELAKVQHYGKAAKALNISQPGLSHAIKTLEEEYGVPLFLREGRNVSLSQYGKELMQDVEEILDAYLRMEERAAGLKNQEKTVRIGTVYPLAPGTIPRMLREFGATFPFIVYNRMTPEIAEGLLNGKYDIGFCSDLLKSEDLEYYPILESYIAAVVPKGHPLEKRDTVSLKEVAKYPQIMFSKTSGFRSLQEQIFAEEGIKVKPVCSAEEIEVVTGLVENGFGISVLPYMDIVRLHNIVTIPVQTSTWKSKFYIARRKYGIRSEQEEAFFRYWKRENKRGD